MVCVCLQFQSRFPGGPSPSSVRVRGVCPLQSIPGSAGGFVDKKALILLCIKFFASSVPESILSRLETFHSPSQRRLTPAQLGMASSSFHITSVLDASQSFLRATRLLPRVTSGLTSPSEVTVSPSEPHPRRGSNICMMCLGFHNKLPRSQ